MQKDSKLAKTKEPKLAKDLEAFGQQVDRAIVSPRAKVSSEARRYARAVERGANDKARRGERHVALLERIESFFSPK